MKVVRCLLGCLILLPGLGLGLLAQPQPPPILPPEIPMQPDGAFWPPLVLPSEQRLTERLAAARDYIRARDYTTGLKQVQIVLDTPEDFLVKPKAEPGKQTPTSWQSVRRLAETIFDDLSPQGRDTYRTMYEPPARIMLAKARNAGDPQLLAEIVRRYRYTASGEEALGLLAAYYVDRGLFPQASRCYVDLLRMTPADKQGIGTLVRAVSAFRGAGNAIAAEKTWLALQQRGSGGKVRLDGKEVALVALDQTLGKAPQALARSDARVFRGDDRRNAAYQARPPLLEAFVTAEVGTESIGRDQLTRARSGTLTALPGWHPVAVGNKVMIRSTAGISAFDAVTGQPAWTAPMELSLDGLLRDPARKQQYLRWSGYYREGLQSLLYENTLTGTLATDGQNVYAVEDTALPVPPFMLFEMAQGRKHLFSTLRDWLACNRLRAFDVTTGKPAWELGGPKNVSKVPEFTDVLFLGPPLPLEGLLWVLVEKQQKLILYALDPSSGATRWSQSLGAVSDKIQMNLLRRCSAVHLSSAEGLLLVPTHHGAILAVDPLARNLVWAHTYADKGAINWDNISPELAQMREMWKMGYKGGAPLVSDGRIVLTGPDTQAIRCLRVEDGQLLWTAEPTEEDQYVAAVHQNVVLIVGRASCRAISLKDGKSLWAHPTGVPSGQGVLGKDGSYWLPLQEGGLMTLDLATGKAPVRLGSPSSPVLGNLIVHEGAFWSQDALKLAAYPDVGKRLLALDELLVLNPENLVARLDRAQMRLGQGETQGAMKDLRQVLAAADLDDARRNRGKDLLFATLTQLLLRDPDAAEPYLPEYLLLCDVPVPGDVTPEVRTRLERDRSRRRLQAAGLVSRNYALKGRHGEAAELLLRLIRSGTSELVPTVEEPTVEARADIQGERTLREILRGAPPAGQQAIRKAVALASREPSGPGGSEGLFRLMRVADLLSATERQAFLVRLLETTAAPTRLLLLLDSLEGRLTAPAEVAAVLLTRAEAMARFGLAADAAECYRRLGKEFANVAVRDGKTGATLLAEAILDKRLLGIFEGPAEWTASRYSVKEERVPSADPPQPLVLMTDTHNFGFTQGPPTFDSPVSLERPALSLARSVRIAYEPKDRKIHVQDATGATLWTVPTQSTPVDRMVQGLPPGGYLVLGSMALAHVNNTLYGLDLLERRVRWSHKFLEPEKNPQAFAGLTFSVLGRLEAYGPDGMSYSVRVGMGGPAAPDRVLLQLRGGMAAIDPTTGQFLWQRGDLPPGVVIGDADTVLLVEAPPNDGTIRQLRALRPSDGRVVRLIPGAKEMMQLGQRLRVVGRDVVTWQPNQGGEQTLRRIDLVTGAERWTRKLPGNTMFLEALHPTMIGVWNHTPNAPADEVRPMDLETGKDLGVVLKVESERLPPNESHLLLRDADRWYIVSRRAAGQGFQGDPSYHLPITVPVTPANGLMHAFDLQGRLQWRARLPGQMLVLDPFERVPFILGVSQVVRDTVNPGSPGRRAVLIRVIDKKSGKLLFNHEEELPDNIQNPQKVPYYTPFTGLTYDPVANWLDLIGPAVRLRLTGK